MLAGVVVARRVHCLRQVDDHRAIAADQDVVFAQIAMHDAGAKHAHHLDDQAVMEGSRQLRRELQVTESGRRVALVVGDELHQQHAFVEVVGLGHAHAGGGQAVERIHFGALPGSLLSLPPEPCAFGHGAGLPAVLGLAVLRIVHGLTKAALVGLLVDLGAARFIPTAHHEDRGFLPAHQLAHHAIDEPIFDQRFKSLGYFHGRHSARFGTGSSNARRVPGRLLCLTPLPSPRSGPGQALSHKGRGSFRW